MNINPAYLAGVLDSDGSFTVAKRRPLAKNPNYIPMIQLTWKKSEGTESFMNQLVAEYGGSFSSCKSTNTMKSFSGTKDYLKYSATGAAVEKIVIAIMPFILLKRSQAENLLELRKIANKNGKNRLTEVSEKMEFLYSLNKSLNTKNGWKNER